ncbi:MAG: homoserine dehydrogenase [Candidatus Cloacimonetes bacterium]|nr:homoserine dehydrogenase [Candidatus Cloacimonadota bacterium]
MRETKLAIIGCGTVGQGLLQIIKDKNADIVVVAISDMLKGSLLDPDGIDISLMLDILSKGGKVDDFDKVSPSAVRGLDAIETIRQCDADIVAEMTYTDIKTGQPATSHIEAALKKGMHVTTSNKGPAALYYKKLSKLATDNEVKFLIEGTVMSGTPVFNLARECFEGCKISEVKGILNGTTNYILTQMENEGWSYKDALKKAQELGYAEADPTADVEGYDALAKVVILSNVLLGGDVKPDDVQCEGISKISLEDIKSAAKEGMRYKLIGSTKLENDKIIAAVKPVKLSLSNPLAGVGGANNALTFNTDLLGKVTIQGAGAGKIETGYSIFVDILNTIGI